jgi:hypothetical protein
MRRFLTMLALALVMAACGGESNEHHQETGEPGGGHGAHVARHGGEVIVLGDHEAHVEAVVDHGAGRISLWVYDGEMGDLEPDAAPVLNLVGRDGPVQVVGTGSGASWTFEDDALEEEPESARFQLVIGGKPYTAELPHDHGHEGHE